MNHYNLYRDKHGNEKLYVSLRGQTLMRQPLLNKGTSYSPDERRAFDLEGLLPKQHTTLELQARRTYRSFQANTDPLQLYMALAGLQDRNEHLFYRLLCDHLAEYMPIVYTPTVGQATQYYSEHYRRGRGVWITPDHKGKIAEVLYDAATWKDVELIVATDNESILGIGDQGAGGIAFTVGKLALYCAAAGIHPAKTLPVSLDVGTDNPALLDNELYVGWRQPRLRGAEYDELVEEFVEAVVQRFPGALVQWEDFRKDNALKILVRYRDRLPSFNDDIQGTGAVALAGVLSGLRITGGALEDQRILIHGAGAAGLGIARRLAVALSQREVSDDDARASIGLLDSKGLLVDDRPYDDDYKRGLAWTASQAANAGLGDASSRTLADVVRAWRPTVLIGSSGQAGAFDEDIVRAMADNTDRPIILPFSNPTSNSEAKPADVLRWTGGRALVATGSPFEDVELNGRTWRIGQGNNVFVFPGLGMGTLLSRSDRVTDGMLSAAADALARAVTDDELDQGLLFPAIDRLREVSAAVTAAVMRQARDEEVGEALDDEAIDRRIAANTWDPAYPEFIPV